MPPLVPLPPPGSSMSLIHTLTVTIISSSPPFHPQNAHSPTFLCSETRSSKKPLKLVLTLSLIQHSPSTNYFFFVLHLVPRRLTQIAGERDCGNLLPPAYTCRIRESFFATFSARCILSRVLPTFTTREMIPSNIPKGGRQAWADEI